MLPRTPKSTPPNSLFTNSTHFRSDSAVSAKHHTSGVSAARLPAAARPPSPGPARGAYTSVATEAAEPARAPYPHRREHLLGSRQAVRGAYLFPVDRKRVG